jgi:hypothetical protein
MKINYFLFFLFFSASSCINDKEQLSSKNDLSFEVLTLYHRNEELLQLFKGTKLPEVIKIAFVLHEISGELTEQSGGVDRNGRFIDPDNKGNFLRYLIEKEGAKRILEETLEDMKGSQYYKSIENNLNIYLLDEQSEYYLPTSNNTYLQMSLILLVYENSLLINYILDNKDILGSPEQ